jgi:hypothetical protein
MAPGASMGGKREAPARPGIHMGISHLSAKAIELILAQFTAV